MFSKNNHAEGKVSHLMCASL